jgi:adenylate cyclase
MTVQFKPLFRPSPKPASNAAGRPVIEWLNSGVADGLDHASLLSALGSRLRRAGLMIDRLVLHLGTLHPEVFDRTLAWAPGEPVEVYEQDHRATVSAGFAESPFREAAIIGSKLVVRVADAKFAEALRTGVLGGRGLLELVAVPLSGLGGLPVIASFCTTRATFFSAADHRLIDSVQAALQDTLQRRSSAIEC